MIIITGDSWGCGEWQNMTVIHGGLGQYLKEHGFKVVNLSLGSSSNFCSYLRLKEFLESGVADYLPKISHVIFFQTDWTRDYRVRPDIPNVGAPSQWFFPEQEITDIQSYSTSQFQYRLSNLAQAHDLKIGLVGGCSDTIWLDKFSLEYPGVEILCQSFVNLCINNNHRIQTPVYTLTPDAIDLLQKTQPNRASKNQYIQDLSLAIDRRDILDNNKNYFWPDGKHANRLGHKKLFDYIMSTNFL
jgi:hypothetical protein